jgi:hypothetical protein
MKNIKLLNKLATLLIVPAFVIACDGDEDGPSTAAVQFESVGSSYEESAGEGTITIPLQGNGSTSDLDFVLGGSATEGEDYEFLGLTGEGVQVHILDDDKFEFVETITIRMTSPTVNLNGNAVHTVTIVNDCADDFVGLGDSEWFVDEFNATEIYAPDDTYGPYHTVFERDEVNPNKFWTDNFWDSGLPAYIVYDPATNTVSFPQQTPVAASPTRIITSTPATVDVCNRTFTITTSYRGSTWDYEFVRPL